MAIATHTLLAEHDSAFCWANVRPVYRKLYFDFHLLTDPFYVRRTLRTDLDLAHLITAMEVVDRYLDDIPEPDSRRKFTKVILEFLAGESFVENWTDQVDTQAAGELSARLRQLRTIIDARGFEADFLVTVGAIFRHTELKCQAEAADRFIAHLIDEWRLAGHLTVLILGAQSNRKFEEFFYPFCEMMSAVDTIADIRIDYKAGRLKLKPSLWLYTKLLAVAIRRLPKLFWRFPARWQLVKYGLPFLLNPK